MFGAARGARGLYLLSLVLAPGYIDTNEESEPLWNKVSDAQLGRRCWRSTASGHDTTVSSMVATSGAAARVAQRGSVPYAGSKTCACLTRWQ
ncbi:hypothetical protein LNQ03_08390 [Klebsiella pneumoniae subsp. pneumoniae]|nr:hypothetical protein [Klebsiella pneumoniae subsp. pneumoniae]